MKAPIYLSYPVRSLLRGGSYPLLAAFCIAVGVMTVVAIQFVGSMALHTYSQDPRGVLGGDIALTQGGSGVTITQKDLSFLEQLKSAGTILNYTPVNLEQGSINHADSALNVVDVQVVDPNTFPLVPSSTTFLTPAHGNFATLLTGNQVVVTQSFQEHYHKHIGDRFDIVVQPVEGSRVARTLHARLAGVIEDGGIYSGADYLIVSFAAYQAADPTVPVTYSGVNITTSDKNHTQQALVTIRQQIQQNSFSLVQIKTTANIQQSVQLDAGQTTQLQELGGLLALLLAGMGIMNTLLALFSRRGMEIAMLKAMGYSRRKLIVLFGVEAGLLGLIGSLIAIVAAIGVSFGIATWLLHVNFMLDPLIIVSGIVLGIVTAIIYGLLPIVQSANLRPIQVLRQQSGDRVFNNVLALPLLALLGLLYCIVASIVLKNVVLGFAAVGGTIAVIVLLYLCFRPLLMLVSAFPVPERYDQRYLLVVLAGVVIAVAVFFFLPPLGGMLLAIVLLALLVRWFPRTWKINIRIGLSNLSRRPARTTMLMLILFIGVFVIGCIQMIGQDLQDQLYAQINTNLAYNVLAKVPLNQSQSVQALLATLPGLSTYRDSTLSSASLNAVNGQPWQSFIPQQEKKLPLRPGTARYNVLHSLNGLEGYELNNQSAPDPSLIHIVAGRNLNASDTGTSNVLIPQVPSLTKAFHLDLGSTLTFVSTDGKLSKTVTIVGIYTTSGITISYINPVLAPQSIVTALSPLDAQELFYLKVSSTSVAQAEARLGSAVANVAFLQTPASRVDDFLYDLTNIVWSFTAIASQALLAGIVIIANAVVMDLLERRREMGILKAVGYTRTAVLGAVLVEYGVLGSVSAFLAALVTIPLVTFFGNLFLRVTMVHLGVSNGSINLAFDTRGTLLVGLIVGSALLTLFVSLFSSWKSVQVRPLEVLRYE
ncbi:ABC transporter permease [Dictyobacter formicarum]|uniref:ABC transporter permease n=1 Tax=Dictyobacter formicarum TaxID=2778368 RepID=A0ABQ3V9C3_9CHLR|nr:FtsX-like permease family protein [Dictyobacter formicarum]GHO82444.1 hypothetical protein KSZ_04500 [Dictyobacter formicarum]